MDMRLVQVVGLLAMFHGIQTVPAGGRSPPIRAPIPEKVDKAIKNADAASEPVGVTVKDIAEGSVNIIKSFNEMADSLKRQAKDAVQDFQKKLDDTTNSIGKKFQEHKERLFKSTKHGVTLTNLSDIIAQKNRKIQGDVRQVMHQLNKKMKDQLEKTNTQVKHLEKQLADNFGRTMKSFKSSLSNFFTADRSA